MLNLFTEFGITQTSFGFTFSSVNTDIGSQIIAFKRFYEKNMFGETLTGFRVLASPEFMDSLTSHASIKPAFQYYVSSQNPLRTDVREGFEWKSGGMKVIFEEYVGEANNLNTDNSVTVRRFIPAGEAIVIPLGTRQLFRTYFAPADFVTEANKMGQTRYAKMAPDPSGLDKFMLLHTQQNPLPMVTRPQLIARLFSN